MTGSGSTATGSTTAFTSSLGGSITLTGLGSLGVSICGGLGRMTGYYSNGFSFTVVQQAPPIVSVRYFILMQ